MKLTDLLFPRKCPFCRNLLQEGEVLLCGECRRTLPWTGNVSRSRGSFFSVCISPLYYDGRARDALLRFKFSGKRSYAACFGRLTADCVKAELDERIDAVTYVPLSLLRLRQRGYSQTRLLAEAMSRELDIPCIRLLRKRRHTRKQSSLHGEAARKANVSGAFAARNGADIAGKTILLVDDVRTTGATLAECSRILLMAGAEKVVCATLCRAQSRNQNKKA